MKISELSHVKGSMYFCLGPVMRPSNILSVLLYRISLKGNVGKT